MKVLVIGGGGREHALAWKLAQSPKVQMVYVAPGNAGTVLEEGVENVAITAIPDLIEFVKREHIELTVVGPEAPLVAGLVDELLLYYAATLLGNPARGMLDFPVLIAMSQRIDLDIVDIDRVGQDIRIRARPR